MAGKAARPAYLRGDRTVFNGCKRRRRGTPPVGGGAGQQVFYCFSEAQAVQPPQPVWDWLHSFSAVGVQLSA